MRGELYVCSDVALPRWCLANRTDMYRRLMRRCDFEVVALESRLSVVRAAHV